MTVKARTPGQTAVSISLPSTLLDQIDVRAEGLGLNRSQYLAALARLDLESRGTLTLSEAAAPPTLPDATPTTYRKNKSSSASKKDTEGKILDSLKRELAKKTPPPKAGQ